MALNLVPGWLNLIIDHTTWYVMVPGYCWWWWYPGTRAEQRLVAFMHRGYAYFNTHLPADLSRIHHSSVPVLIQYHLVVEANPDLQGRGVVH